MSEQRCANCQYYLRHYTFDRKSIFRVYCGHCTLSKVRQKRPDAAACENFIAGPGQEDAFVSKEYLSKQLLQYMLALELLPEIEDKDPAFHLGQ